MHNHQNQEDEDEAFGSVVHEQEGKAVERRNIFSPDSFLFRGGFVVALCFGFITMLGGVVGGVWGIAISFKAFTTSQENTRGDVDTLRSEQVKIRDEIAALRKKVLNVKEGDLWAESLRIQNAGKLIVPKPSDYKIEP